MKKLIIIGAGGMAGHMIYAYLEKTGKYEMCSISRSGNSLISDPVRLASSPQLEDLIEKADPDIIINCAGILTSNAEKNPDLAILVNSYLPHRLAALSERYHFRMIQLSTDCEFSGKRGGYKEDDIPDATDIYGRTKALGEVNMEPHLNIRTSFIGPELKSDGVGLFNWFMKQKGIVKGYKNAIWTGITTLELAKCIEKAIDNNIAGLYQLVNEKPISKYELLVLFKEIFDRQAITVEQFEGMYRSDKSLISSRHELPVKGYYEMLIEMKAWMHTNKEWYPQYFQQV
jgi:dTDP-4-dehydrorhamnose reductase